MRVEDCRHGVIPERFEVELPAARADGRQKPARRVAHKEEDCVGGWFLELAPSLIAREARSLRGAPLERALDAYAKARELAAVAPRVSLDAAATVFQIGGILASVPDSVSLKR